MKNFVFKMFYVFLLCSASILCQTGTHKHDGDFIRMLLGAGYAELVEEDVMGSDLKFSGLTVPFRFQIGAQVSKNLIVYGEFGYASQTNPEMEWMGQSGSSSYLAVSVMDLGLGITYYLMPANIYFSLSMLFSFVQLEYNNTESGSSIDIDLDAIFDSVNGINVMVGKEWWVGNQWALGVALYGYFSDMQVQTSIEGINYEYYTYNYSIGAMFSFTYN